MDNFQDFDDKYLSLLDEKKTTEEPKTEENAPNNDSNSTDIVRKRLWEIFLDEFLNHEILKKVMNLLAIIKF